MDDEEDQEQENDWPIGGGLGEWPSDEWPDYDSL